MYCRNCGHEMSDFEAVCPNCGFRDNDTSLNSEPGSGKKAGIGGILRIDAIIVCLILLLVPTVLFLFTRKSGETNRTEEPGQKTESEVDSNTENETMNSSPEPAAENEEEELVPSDEPAKESIHYVLPTAIPEEYYFYRGHTYAFYDASRYGFETYEEVSDFCHEQGGHLAVINDRSENSFLYDLMKENYKITVFFGYTDKDEEGVWVWDGDDSQYENWTRSGDWNLPDNGESWGGGEWKNGGEDYAEFNYDRDTNWGAPNDTTWNDATFMENTTIFFCEWDYDMREAESLN